MLKPACRSRRVPGADGNEVAATLAALKTVSLKGCVVTGDALHCHPAKAQQVRAQGGHYLLKLKANHGPLLAAAQAAFTAAEAQGTLQCSSTEDEANDRIEHRCDLCVFPVPATAPAFPGLVAFGRINSVRTKRGGKTESKTQYAGHVATPAGLAHAVDHATALERGEPSPPPARRGLSRGRRQNPQGQRAGQSICHSTHGTGHPACASAATLHRPQDEPRKVG